MRRRRRRRRCRGGWRRLRELHHRGPDYILVPKVHVGVVGLPILGDPLGQVLCRAHVEDRPKVVADELVGGPRYEVRRIARQCVLCTQGGLKLTPAAAGGREDGRAVQFTHAPCKSPA